MKLDKFQSGRRKFLKHSVITGSGLMILPGIAHPFTNSVKGLVLEPTKIRGLKEVEGEEYLKNAQWFSGDHLYDGFHYNFPAGSLLNKTCLTTDMLADGNHMIKFMIELQEGEKGRIFGFRFGVLNQCSLRLRMPLSLVDQNRWGIDREGAFLKPRCSGDRVDLSKVDRMRFFIAKKSHQTSIFCLTPLMASEDEVELIKHPILPKGKLMDDIGQSTIHHWMGKTKSIDEMKFNLNERLLALNHTFPDHFSKSGGWNKKKVRNDSGFFRVAMEGERWWLVDPDGYLFWSAGVDCVLSDIDTNVHLLEDVLTFIPPKKGEFAEIYSERNGQLHMNHLAANFIRAFGKGDWKKKWAKITMDELVRLRFNTVGNWSDWKYAAESGFPYVRPMRFSPELTKNIYRDFPDVYHPDFEKDALAYAEDLRDTVNDRALIGYFMMNEPQWAFSSELPAVGMLYTTGECSTRRALADFLRKTYTNDRELSEAWNLDVGFETINSGKWKGSFTEKAKVDLENFSERMVEKYFGTLTKACKEVDPNHLNLGIRYAGVPPKWAVAGMRSFDVFSMNCYQEKVPYDVTKEINDLLNMPVIIGEWHFGALDAGLPSSGIGHVPSQEDRGKAYRVYFEDAAANPYCVGVHWFTLYDESALGRFDGENYNIGFLDICNKPYEALCNAAIKSHEHVYSIASGKESPYSDEPEYLLKLF